MNIPKKVVDRVEDINHSRFISVFESSLTTYQNVNYDIKREEDLDKIEDIIVVGSYIKESFSPNESDIDLIIITDSPIQNNLEYFWEFANQRNEIQTLKTNMSVDSIDCNGVKTTDWLDKKGPRDEIFYSLYDREFHKS